MKKVTIISVNYNGLAYTCRMIDSIYRFETYPFKIIIVDNGSKENEAETLQRQYPGITVIRSEKNLGFAGGNNLGIQQCDTDFIFLLNNDTEIKAPVLEKLAERMESQPRIGCVSPKIRFAFENAPIQFAGYTPLSAVTLRNHLIGFKEEDKGQYDIPHPTPFAHGAAMMVKKEVIDKAGLMPENYFLYYEELDWCEQIKKAGYEIWYEPASCIYHYESASTGQGSPLRTYYMARNRLLYAQRNRHGIIRPLAYLYQICIVSPKNILIYALKGDRKLIVPTLRGIWNGITGK